MLLVDGGDRLTGLLLFCLFVWGIEVGERRISGLLLLVVVAVLLWSHGYKVFKLSLQLYAGVS